MLFCFGFVLITLILLRYLRSAGIFYLLPEGLCLIWSLGIYWQMRRLARERDRIDRQLTVLHDMTERERTEQALQESEAHLAEAQRLAGLGSYEYSYKTGEIIWSKEIFRLFDRDPGLGAPVVEEVMNYYHPEDRSLLLSARQAAFQDGQPYEFDIRIRQRDGSYRWCRSIAKPIRDEQGSPLRIVGTLMDINERKLAQQQVEATNEWLEEINRQLATANEQLERQMRRVNEQAVELEVQKAELEAANRRLTALATTDSLTELHNHRGFREKLAEEFERTQRYKTPLSMILLDVDNFKSYNDTFGHPEGDRVLKMVAQRLQQTARLTDAVCRYGGEEFVILLPNTETDGAMEAAERFRLAIENHLWPLRSVTASFGVATLYADLTNAQELVDQADQALYAVKKAGKNRVAHAAFLLTDEAGVTQSDLGLPYTNVIHEMFQLHQETLTSASEQVREVLAGAYDATIESWAHLLDMKDKETEGHSTRVTRMTEELTECIGMNAEERLYARWGALLHDVGKMGVPDAILHKPGPLTEEEWVIMQQHTTLAYEMLLSVSFLRPALDIPYCHHEKWDGTGYPRGLKGEEIPLSARLFAVIDVYDALTSDRPYRQAWSKQKAVTYLRSLSGTHFDPRAVNVFLKMLTTKQTQTAAHPAG
jgi:diguanylate cyclase (GGDEF)-like protein/putative nucleotidyltransferase with HDIG domain